ncbi:hypothetical protein SAMN05216389_103176 [Oceanobacillus limi]|uniref:Uncharacterized protein n=1 Tax=Oceanobacillus limi TaxID=930131 RepID=A0A1I0ADI4_9BACI|nr:hypothetical protein [Oceanobacillus limi]SES91770.1 hypothetical protein SAMN05216389_103176 [Oceanobacillus limi]
MADEKKKKPIYKRWWFWVIIVILAIAIFGGGDDEGEELDNQATDEQEETNEPEEELDEEPDTGETEEDNQEDERAEEAEEEPEEVDEPKTRDNASATETTLNTGTFVVGSDIPAGRYVITGEGSGNLFIYDEGGSAVVNEILDSSGDFGVPSVTTDIEDGQEIEISGLNSVTFTPADTTLSESLSTGTWEVGLDIEPGRYDVTAPNGSGNFFVYNARGLAEVNEILDASGEFGVERITVNLENGQIIEISGLPQVDFEAR